MTRISPLPYCADPGRIFESVADLPWAVLLDGGRHDPGQSRYDIIAAEPWATIVTRAGMSEVRTHTGGRISPDDPFGLLRELLQPAAAAASPAPFAGGAIGYFGYDLGRRLERLPYLAADDEQLPELAVGLYDWAVVIDHQQGQAWLASAGRVPETEQRWPALEERFSRPAAERLRVPFRTLSSIRSNMTRSQYLAAFERIARYIDEGDCYQVNLAQRFEVRASGDPWTAYQALRVLNPAPYSAYLNLPFAQVLSASPERFLHLRDGQVETRPIKGTRPRAGHPRLDAERAQELHESAKDRAENVMIVDLLRNDLAKSCRPGSVRVPRLFEVESFASVHHLVSTVTGELAPGRDALDLLRGCFPGGSITGAPKVRAMQIIEELEPHRRGVYCGSIGYIGYDGAMDSNIAIRTLVYRSGYARFWAGGGIVADSVGADEYQETLDKAAPFLQLVQRCAQSDASG
ncbi:MAG: aminodeoxychorismate synthase component I [Betaproteobacteria bacterium]|nr:aminodeoxychorismate synthase component I [Betaproteobacteria bacterium]